MEYLINIIFVWCSLYQIEGGKLNPFTHKKHQKMKKKIKRKYAQKKLLEI